MGYSEGKDKYADKFVAGICRPLVEAGEFKSMEECKSAAEDDAESQASNWANEAPAAMAAYLQA